MIDVDEGQGDQEPSQHDSGQRWPAIAVLPGYGRGEHTGKGFHHGISNTDLSTAAGTAALKEQIAQNWNVLQGRDGRLARWAGGSRHEQIEALGRLGGGRDI